MIEEDLHHTEHDLMNVEEEEYQRQCEDDLDESNYPEELISASIENSDSRFDRIVGQLEELLVDETFQELMYSFCQKHCQEFEDDETNKLSYTPIFNEYTNLVEEFIDTKLKEYDPSFNMEEFLIMIEERSEEITGDVWDFLHSLGDFQEFKAMMIAQKNDQNGLSIDSGSFLTVKHY